MAVLVSVITLNSCNKEKKLMKRIQGNWNIESSEKTIYRSDGSKETMESITDAGKLVISDGPSSDVKQYEFTYIGSQGDTIHVTDQLLTDEFNERLIMAKGYADPAGNKNLVWTVEKEKKNKQIWSAYGVDSTLFYPSNNNNPGAAGNWVVWKITLKRE
jgi:hypothetical protein